MLTDTHTHICDEAFNADRADVLARAEQSGIRAIIAVGEDLFPFFLGLSQTFILTGTTRISSGP